MRNDFTQELFKQDKEFLEKLNNMNLETYSPSFDKLNEEMKNVGLTDRQKKIIIKLFNNDENIAKYSFN